MLASLKAFATAMGKVLARTRGIPLPGGDEEKSSLMKYILIGVIFMNIIVPAAALAAPGLIVKAAFDKVASFFDFTQKVSETELYDKCVIVYNEYKVGYNEQVDDIVESLKENNIVGYTEEGIAISPDIYTTMHFEDFDVYLLLAYFNTKYFDYQRENDGFKYKKSVARDFMDAISSFKSSSTGTNPIYLDVEISVLPLEDIANKYFSGKETTDGILKIDLYKTSYESLKEDY